MVADVGTQAHAAVPAPDETYILVANHNGQLLQRINTDYSNLNGSDVERADPHDLAVRS